VLPFSDGNSYVTTVDTGVIVNKMIKANINGISMFTTLKEIEINEI
jgi:hypothetical protein